MNRRVVAESGGAVFAEPVSSWSVERTVGTNQSAPTGLVAFLMTDIEGSTRLWDTAPVAMRHSLRRHDELINAAIESSGGYIFCRAGDSFAAAFDDADAALAAAVQSQHSLRIEPWPDCAEVRVRMAIHIGEADERDGNYFGPSLNRCSRLLSLCAGGTISLSSAAAEHIRGDKEMVENLTDVGLYGLADMNEPEHVWNCDVYKIDGGVESACDDTFRLAHTV